MSKQGVSQEHFRGVGDDATSADRKPRKRLKKLMVDICKQIEFYFSDANLRKDRFLSQEMANSDRGYVRLDVIASFNRIKSMSEDMKVVVMAIQQSPVLELSADETLVRRRKPLKPPKYDIDDCTVYVECLPKRADHEWLQKTFSYCGNVVYISLPRYKDTGDIKRFAFIEFECPEEADRACEIMNNPPPDMEHSIGRFPKMKRGKRIVPLEFSSITMSNDVPEEHSDRMPEKRLNKGMRKDDAATKPRHDEDMCVAKRADTGLKQKDCDRGKLKRKRTADDAHDNGNEHGDRDRGTKSNVSGAIDGKKKLDSDGEIKKKVSQKGNNTSARESHSVDVKESKEMRKSQKRSLIDKTEEEAPKSKRETSARGEGRTHSKDEGDARKERKPKESDEKESAEQRKESLVVEAGRKLMKRKRSLSEGDIWEMRYYEETEEQRQDSDADARMKKKLKKDPDGGDEKKVDGVNPVANDVSLGSEMEKKKRSRKKKIKRLQEEEETLFLRVISKHEWLHLKDEYLALQKESLARMKHFLRNQNMTNQLLHKGGTAAEEVPGISQAAPERELAAQLKSTEPELVERTVMKLQCLKPMMSRKEIKDDLERISPVAYIDLPEGQCTGFVRFQSADGPECVRKEAEAGVLNGMHISLSLITGEEEKVYWEKLKLDRINKLNSKKKKTKKRGVDKVLQRAERASSSKTTSHIRFDD